MQTFKSHLTKLKNRLNVSHILLLFFISLKLSIYRVRLLAGQSILHSMHGKQVILMATLLSQAIGLKRRHRHSESAKRPPQFHKGQQCAQWEAHHWFPVQSSWLGWCCTWGKFSADYCSLSSLTIFHSWAMLLVTMWAIMAWCWRSLLNSTMCDLKRSSCGTNTGSSQSVGTSVYSPL